MSVSIDDTYRRVMGSLPLELREAAMDLLPRLGLGAAGRAWSGFFQLEPCRDLPVFAAARGVPVGGAQLDAFRAAHHCACFHGVLADRLADGQAAPSAALARLRVRFLARWRDALARAMGDAALAERSIARGLWRWERGVRMEQAALAGGRLSLKRYARIILLKLGWAGLAGEHVLLGRVDPRRAQRFRAAYLLTILSLQCVDDAMDAGEDAALRGSSVPEALGFSAPAVFSAAAGLARSATRAAAEGEFERFERWSSDRAAELQQLGRERVSAQDRLAGLVIASTLEETCRFITERSCGGSAVTTCSGRSALAPHRTSSGSGTIPSSVP